MKKLLLLVLLLGMTAPAYGLDKKIVSSNTFKIDIFDTAGNGLPGLTLSNLAVKVQCTGAAVTIDESGDTLTDEGGGFYRLTTNDTLTLNAEDECNIWVEGSGDYAGLLAKTPAKFKVVGTTVDAIATETWSAGTRTLTAGTNLNIPTASANADAVWDEGISGHLGAGSAGAALNAAGSAGDPWSTPLPGAYGAGTAGKIVGDALDGHTPQTGDAYAVVNNGTYGNGALNTKIGLPAGASVSADIAAVKAETAAIVDDTGTSGVVVAAGSKSGYSLSTAGIDAILDEAVEGSYTMRQILCASASVLFGKASGGGTTTITFRNLGDTLNRVSETVAANGNRSAVTLNLTGCP